MVSKSKIPSWLSETYPFAQNSHNLPGSIRMNYVDHGEGESVLLLHGNPSWSFLYRDLVQQLSANQFRCIAPDHIGCGLSDKPQAYSYTLRKHIDNIESLVERLKLDSFHLVVHDWGGAIGCGLAVRNPERVRSLSILNTAAFRFSRMPLRIAFCRIPLLGEILIRQFNVFAGGATTMAVIKPMSFMTKRGFTHPYRTWNDRIATARFVQDIPMKSSHQSWGTLCEIEEKLISLSDKPMHLFWGMKDWCFCPSILEHWQLLFPKAEVSKYNNAGHYILEDAGNEALQDINQFLTSNKSL